MISIKFMMMNRKQQEATEIEAELVRLNALVRERRQQLGRLEECPNKDCPCRLVWRNHIEQNLAGQVSKVRRQVRGKPAKVAKPKSRSKTKAVTGPARRKTRRGQPR
jgi:hypothetical protein